MLQKIFLGLVGVTVLVGGVYAYQQRIDNSVIENKKQAIISAYNNFYPQEWNFSEEMKGYERDSLSDILSHYVRDERQKKIYFIADLTDQFNMVEIMGVDYNTFTPIDQSWSRDNHALYNNGKIFMNTLSLPKMMPGGVYMKDDHKVYYTREELHDSIPQADPFSFESLYSLHYYNIIPYARDKNHVYMLGTLVDAVDPATVEVLASFYLQDSKNIYYSDEVTHRIMTGVDRASFEIIPDADGYDARDINHYYYQGEVVDMIQL